MNCTINKILLLFLLLPNIGHGQQIEDGTYIGFNGGLIPKYAILTVNQDSIEFKIFTRWQGAWLPGIGTWDRNYEPQHLKRVSSVKLESSNISIELKPTKTSELQAKARNTFAGRIKFKLSRVDELPSEYGLVREKSLEFTKRD
jgi:hypothetical protein